MPYVCPKSRPQSRPQNRPRNRLKSRPRNRLKNCLKSRPKNRLKNRSQNRSYVGPCTRPCRLSLFCLPTAASEGDCAPSAEPSSRSSGFWAAVVSLSGAYQPRSASRAKRLRFTRSVRRQTHVGTERREGMFPCSNTAVVICTRVNYLCCACSAPS